ncbi:hypothetical protein DC31_02890 [Microbacterium sp. CH12i]|nr:hypothetical protein DC31_02890 [Microbacterium sp. CH12i]
MALIDDGIYVDGVLSASSLTRQNRPDKTREQAMSSTDNSHHIPAPDEPSVPELEEDENIAPRPEEELADILRQAPDVQDHRDR